MNWPGHSVLFGIGEGRLQLDRAGGRVDRVVGRQQRALVEFRLAVRCQGGDRQLPGSHRQADARQGVLRQGEEHRDRMDLGDRHDPCRVPGMHHVARIDLAQADTSLKRRGDGAVAEVQPRCRDRRIVAGDHRGQAVDHRLLGIDLLVRGETALRQRRVPRQVALRVVEVRLVLGSLRQHRVERRLKRSRIDHREDVAFLHLLALGDRHLHQRAVDPAAHLHGVERLHRAQAGEIQRHILTKAACDGDRDGSRCALRARLLRRGSVGQTEGEADTGGQHKRKRECQLQARMRGAIVLVSHHPKSVPSPSTQPGARMLRRNNSTRSLPPAFRCMTSRSCHGQHHILGEMAADRQRQIQHDARPVKARIHALIQYVRSG